MRAGARQRRSLAARRSRREVLPLAAGPETSVAATKSFIASLAAIAQLVADWSGRRGAPRRARRSCPSSSTRHGSTTGRRCDRLASASISTSSAAASASAVAQEAALKLKETCGSTPKRSAPPRSGTDRWRSSGPAFPALSSRQSDETREASTDSPPMLRRAQARDVFLAGARRARRDCAASRSGASPLLEPILQIQSLLPRRRSTWPSRAASTPTVRRTSPR